MKRTKTIVASIRTHAGYAWSIVVLCLLSVLPTSLFASPLYTSVAVTTNSSGERITYANSSRNVTVSKDGTIFVALRTSSGIWVARSRTRGASFESPVKISAEIDECELTTDSAGVVYVVWVHNGSIRLSRSTNQGASFSATATIGRADSTARITTRTPYVYIMPNQGTNLYKNSNSGVGAFSSIPLPGNGYFADIFANPQTADVYAFLDLPNPGKSYVLSSTNNADSFTSTNVIPENIFYASSAASFSGGGNFLLAGGAESSLYRLNVDTKSLTSVNVLPANDRQRSLSADQLGNVLNAVVCSSGTVYCVSTNQGASFGASRKIGGQVDAISATINPLYGDIVFTYQDNGRIYCNTYANELVNTNVELIVTTSSAKPQYRPGDEIVYSMHVTNKNGQASPVTVSNELPFYVTFKGANSGWQEIDSKHHYYEIASLDKDEGITLTITGKVELAASGALTTRTTVHSPQLDMYPANNTNLYSAFISGRFEVKSAHGEPVPAVGIYTNDYARQITNTVISPVTVGRYQYESTGWTLSGNAPAAGSGTSFVMVQTNDAILSWRWGITNVNLNLSTAGSGTITGNTQAWARLNTTLRLDANPDPHWHFATWTGDTSGVDPASHTIFPTMNLPKSLVARFAIDQHNLTVLSSVPAAVAPSIGTHTYNYGQNLTLTSPALYEIPQQTQYLCTGWTLTGNSPASGTTRTTPMTLTNDATLRWNWGTTNVYLRISSDSYGHVEGAAAGWHTLGSSQTLTAVEDRFSHFIGWSGDVPTALTNNRSISLPMDRPRQVYAHFSIEQRDLTVSSAYGAPNPSVGSHTYNCLQPLTPQVNSPISDGSHTQYVSTGWTMNGHAPAAGTARSFSMTVTNHATLKWLWQTNVRFTVQADGPGTVRGAGTGWYPIHSSVTVTAVPSAYARFIGWSGTIPAVATNTNPLTISLPRYHSVIAHFYRDPITLTVQSAYGSPSPSVGTQTNYMGKYVAASCPATYETGSTQYLCTGWTMLNQSPVSGSTNEFSMTQTNNATLKWLWGQTNVYLAVETNGHGTISGATAGFYPLGSAVTVTAHAITSGQFLFWDKDVPASHTNNSTVVLTMNRSRTIRGNFTLVQRTLSIQSAYGTPTPSVGNHVYTHGSAVHGTVNSTIHISATEQKRCGGFTLTGNSPPSGIGNTVNITLTNNAALVWRWNTFYDLQVTADSSGTVTANNGFNLAGTTVQCTPKPNVGYRFKAWTGDIPPALATDNPLLLTLDRARSFHATFEEFYPVLTMLPTPYGSSDPAVGTHTHAYGGIHTNVLSGSPIDLVSTQFACVGWSMPSNAPVAGNGTTCIYTATNHTTFQWLWQTNVALDCATNGTGRITGDTNHWHRQLSVIELNAEPQTGFEFVGWSGDVAGAATNSNPLYLTMNAQKSVVAHFETARMEFEVQSRYGIATPSIGVHTNLYGLLLSNSVSAVAPGGVGTQYVCTGWNMPQNNPTSGITNTFTMNQTNDAVLTWRWSTNVLLNAQPTEGGMISGSPNRWYKQGTAISLTAIASNNYEFDSWAGDIGSANSNSTSIALTMNQARTVEARFKLKLQIDFALYGISVYSTPERDAIDAVIQVCNQGTDRGDGGLLTLWVNRSTPASCGEVGNYSQTIGFFEPGEIQTIVITNLPAGSGSGTRRLLVYVDSQCKSYETDENNNQFDVEYTYLGPVYDPFSFTAFGLTDSVSMRWIQPTRCGASTDRVLIRYRPDHYPDGSSDGTEIYRGTATHFMHTNATPNQRYYYRIWCSDGVYWVDPPEY